MLNLRIISSFAMLSLFLVFYFLLEPVFFQGLILVIGGLLLFELSKLLKLNGLFLGIYWFFSALFIFLYFTSNINYKLFSYLSLFFWFFFVPIDLYLRALLPNVVKIFYGLLFITPLLISVDHLFHFDKLFLLILITMIWVADIGAYFFGKKFGAIKLVKNISPGKTLEGVYGAVISNSLFSFLLYHFLDLDLINTLIIACMVTLLSIYGDIYESLLKRKVNIKDSGNLIPGHGGFLDRMDGFCSTLPIINFVCLVFPSLKII
ncbi:MAG: phosphatidate cytidylyltransferase [Methylophilaceae bacterium]